MLSLQKPCLWLGQRGFYEFDMIVLNMEASGYSEKAKERWRHTGYRYEELTWAELNSYNNSEDVEILIVRLGAHISLNQISQFNKLKTIISATTGVTHLEVDELKAAGISCVTLRGQNEFLRTLPATAELTWGLLLSFVRKIHLAREDVIEGNWNREAFKGFQLAGKSIGVIGLGRIGTKLASYADAFGMDVLYFDPRVESKKFRRYHDLHDMLSKCDIVSLHIHNDSDNFKFFNKSVLESCRKGVIVMNSSRGEIWDEMALKDGLKTGHVGGIVADVLHGEHINVEESELWEIRNDPRVLLTPHIGGACSDAMQQCELHVQSLVLKAQ